MTAPDLASLLADHPLPWVAAPAVHVDGWAVTDARGLVLSLCSSAEVAELLANSVSVLFGAEPTEEVTP